MMFTEVFVPKGRLTADRRRRLAQGFMGCMTGAGEEMDERQAAVFASQFQVVVHEPETWVVGSDLAGDPPPYLVRVHVPGPWRKDTSEHIITTYTRLIVEEDPGAAVQVHVLGVADGSMGVRGEAKTSTGLVEMMNDPLRQDLAEGRAVVDPICDMIVMLDKAPTLEWEGTLYGFCCKDCRTEFVKRQEKKAARAASG